MASRARLDRLLLAIAALTLVLPADARATLNSDCSLDLLPHGISGEALSKALGEHPDLVPLVDEILRDPGTPPSLVSTIRHALKADLDIFVLDLEIRNELGALEGPGYSLLDLKPGKLKVTRTSPQIPLKKNSFPFSDKTYVVAVEEGSVRALFLELARVRFHSLLERIAPKLSKILLPSLIGSFGDQYVISENFYNVLMERYCLWSQLEADRAMFRLHPEDGWPNPFFQPEDTEETVANYVTTKLRITEQRILGLNTSPIPLILRADAPALIGARTTVIENAQKQRDAGLAVPEPTLAKIKTFAEDPNPTLRRRARAFFDAEPRDSAPAPGAPEASEPWSILAPMKPHEVRLFSGTLVETARGVFFVAGDYDFGKHREALLRVEKEYGPATLFLGAGELEVRNDRDDARPGKIARLIPVSGYFYKANLRDFQNHPEHLTVPRGKDPGPTMVNWLTKYAPELIPADGIEILPYCENQKHLDPDANLQGADFRHDVNNQIGVVYGYLTMNDHDASASEVQRPTPMALTRNDVAEVRNALIVFAKRGYVQANPEDLALLEKLMSLQSWQEFQLWPAASRNRLVGLIERFTESVDREANRREGRFTIIPLSLNPAKPS